MAMTGCRECGKEVSTEAKSCPHCGVPNPARTIWQSMPAIVVSIIIVVMIGTHYSSGGSSSTSAATRNYTSAELDDHAKYACGEFFKQSAHDPNSLEWLGMITWPIAYLPDDMRDIQMRMRGKNAYGALVVTDKTCRIQRTSSGDWKLISFRD